MADTAIGYIRVSTTEQAQDGISLEMQTQRIRQYADLYDIDLIDVEIDAGVSGKTMVRDGLGRALMRLKAGEASALLIFKLDRLTRSVADLGHLIDEYFGPYRLLSVSDQIDTQSATGRLVLNVLGSVSQWEREQIAERTSQALQHKKSNMEVYNHAPLGYRADDGKLVPIDEEQRVVADIRQLREQGLSMRRIADDLNRRGIVGKRNGRFYASTIKAILDNGLHANLRA